MASQTVITKCLDVVAKIKPFIRGMTRCTWKVGSGEGAIGVAAHAVQRCGVKINLVVDQVEVCAGVIKPGQCRFEHVKISPPVFWVAIGAIP